MYSCHTATIFFRGEKQFIRLNSEKTDVWSFPNARKVDESGGRSSVLGKMSGPGENIFVLFFLKKGSVAHNLSVQVTALTT